MAILKIARMGHPVLRRRADPVSNPADPVIARLVDDMVETIRDAPGIGLAAPQVHVPLRVVVFCVPRERTDRQDTHPESAYGEVPLTVLINPQITPIGDEKVDGVEGCLSVPGLVGVVPRWTRIRYQAVDLAGAPIDRVAEGFHARVVQHECDHLNGILYPQRMTDLSRLSYVEEKHWTETLARQGDPVA